MNLLAKLLPTNNIELAVEASSKKRVFEYAAMMFENQQGIEHSKVFDSLLARERLGSTGLGQGVAIPHGRIKGLKEAVAAIVSLNNPVAFDAPDAQPVSFLIFYSSQSRPHSSTLKFYRNWPNCCLTKRFAKPSNQQKARAKFCSWFKHGSRLAANSTKTKAQ